MSVKQIIFGAKNVMDGDSSATIREGTASIEARTPRKMFYFGYQHRLATHPRRLQVIESKSRVIGNDDGRGHDARFFSAVT